MKFFKKFFAILGAYDYRDKIISFLALAVFFLMIVKMIFFPYGIFGFGDSNIYTEGMVSKNGIQNINPLFVDYNEADREVSRLVFAGLMKYDPAKAAIVDDMAVLSINEAKTEYTFTLREGVKWHDGKEVTADDVFFTYNDVVMNPNFPNEILKTNFAGVTVEKLDARSVKFKLEKPNVFFISNFTTGILPKHVLSNVDPSELLQHQFNKLPVGTGPYMVTDPAEDFGEGHMQITLSQNPYYYGDPVGIELMKFIVFPTMDQLLEDINSVNAVVKVTGKYISTFQENERFNLLPYQLPQYTAVFMNMDSLLLKDDKNVRLALQKAIDKKALIEMFKDKLPVDTPLMELNQDEWEYKPSVDEANGALKESGYLYELADTEKKGPRTNDNSEPLNLNFVVRLYEEGTDQFEETKQVVTFLKESWEKVGIGIEVEFLPPDVFKERVMARKYDLLLVGQSLGYNLDTYSYWHSSQATSSGQNLSNYRSFGVDSLIEDIRSVFNEEKKKRELQDMAEQIKEDIPAVFLYRPIYYYAGDGKVSGIMMDGVVFPSDRFTGIAAWKFSR